MIGSDAIRGYNDTFILSILQSGASYGYAISKRIREISKEQYSIKETTLYSAFTRLEKNGYIESFPGEVTHGKKRTYYQITHAGERYLEEKLLEWEVTKDVVGKGDGKMKIIEEFIDSLFSGVVETSETKQLKADLLANAEDRYEDLLSQGKSENEAIGTIISEFGTIDELMEELNLENKQVDETNDSMNGLPEISVEEGLDYLAVQRKGAIQIGLGVVAIMVGVGLLVGMRGVLSNGLGLVCLFIGVAIGVPLFIVAGNRFVAMDKQLGQRLIPIKLKKEVAQREQSFQRSFIFCMAAGVVFCILGLIPVVVFSSGLHLMMRRSMHQMMGGQYYNGTMGISWLFFLVSVGVFLFIFGGVIKGSFNKLLNETYFYSEHVGHPDFAPQQTKTEEGPVGNPVGAIIASVYWPLVVALYLFISFSWLIFMFAGIFYNTIQAFLHKH